MSETLFAEAETTPPDPRIAHLVAETYLRLLSHYGAPEPREIWDPLTQFIYCLISARTLTPVSHAALRTLLARFGVPGQDTKGYESPCLLDAQWEGLRDASIADIEAAIEAVSFPDAKALNLKLSLTAISERTGALSLDFLAKYRTEKIRAWIEQFPGAGNRTAAAVANFSTLRRMAMCMDGHHLRVVQRLGLARRGADPGAVESRLMRHIPANWIPATLDQNHKLIKLHGQTLCTFADPQCPKCPLLDLCPFGQKHEVSPH